MTISLDTPLSDDELVELDDFLLSGEDEEQRLPVDEAHGFITGLLVGRSPFNETEWMEVVWGQPAFANAAQQEHFTNLLRRLYADVQRMLADDQAFEPLVAEMEEDGEVFEAYEGWCFGFMLAVSRDEERWGQLPKDEQSILSPIAKLALLHSDEHMEMEDDEHDMLIDLLPGSVQSLNRFWAAHAEA